MDNKFWLLSKKKTGTEKGLPWAKDEKEEDVGAVHSRFRMGTFLEIKGTFFLS